MNSLGQKVSRLETGPSGSRTLPCYTACPQHSRPIQAPVGHGWAVVIPQQLGFSRGGALTACLAGSRRTSFRSRIATGGIIPRDRKESEGE